MTTASMARLEWRERAPAYLAGAAAATAPVSIAASQILLGMALVALYVAGREQFRWPPVTIPVAAWMGWTLVSLAASPDPVSGLPQVKKFYVYLMLFAVYAALRSVREVRWVALGWIAGATLSSLWGLVQFAYKYKTTDRYFYFVYSNQRITGFMEHWMTFGGLLMIALMMTGALLLFARDRRWFGWLFAAAAILGVTLRLSLTRSVWLGVACGGMWLLWARKRWLVVLLPLVAGLVIAASPDVRERLDEVVHPRVETLDVTAHRETLLAAGWQMIRAHPLVGVGPEQVAPQFLDYLPARFKPIPKDWYYGHLHNIYVHFAAERGIPALLALLALLGKALYDFLRGLRRLPASSEARWVLHGAIATIIAVMVEGLFELNLGDSEVLAMFLGVVACGYVALREAETAGRASAGP